MCLGFVPRFCVYSLFCNIVLCVLSSLTIIIEEERAGCVHIIAFLLLCVCLSHTTGTKRLDLIFFIFNHLHPFQAGNYFR